MYRLAPISLKLQKKPRRIFYPWPLAGTNFFLILLALVATGRKIDVAFFAVLAKLG